MGSAAGIRVLLLAAAVLSSCGAEDEKAAAVPAQFTVRGRWEDPTRLSYRIESEGAPVAAEAFSRAIERAMVPWNETGVVGFAPARWGATADVTFAWRRGNHDECEPFGVSTAFAHSGPVARGTFVHFDAGRAWSEDGDAGHSLFHTALHEIGHVLGLGHTPDEDALMRPDAVRIARLMRSDLAGLHSLYGGGMDAVGDLMILGGGEEVAVLREAAPADTTEYTVFDTDGDGADEVVVWRTDPAGHGALMIYFFGPGPRLRLTHGPHYGMSAPGVPTLFLRTPDGARLMVCVYDSGKTVVRRFDERGGLVPGAASDLPEELLLVALSARERAEARMVGDLDGDGRRDEILAVRQR